MPKLINWKGLIYNGCEILTPVDENKVTGIDYWNIKCHCGKIFSTARPISLKQNLTKSCGCLAIEYGKVRGLANKKYNYFNFINPETNIKLLRPVDADKIGSQDDWIALCPHHDPEVEFIIKANSVAKKGVSTTSCGCLFLKCSSEKFIKYHKEQRLNQGLKENEYLLDKNNLLRRMLHEPIRNIIFRRDKYLCQFCKNKTHDKLNTHHIIPLSTVNYQDINTFKIIYDFNNLITLCEECHDKAHNYWNNDLNISMQQELIILIKTLLMSEELLNEYNTILINEILPWMKTYGNGNSYHI